MAQKTLLRMVQDILYDMDSDEVETILDTTESIQVARKIENVYWDIVTRFDLPAQSSFYTLVESGNILKPTVMTLPSTALSLETLKYKTPDTFVTLDFIPVNDFMEMQYQNIGKDNITEYVITVGSDDFNLYPLNDTQPKYYTTFDDETILFDSYDSDIDDYLESEKTVAYGKLSPAFEQTDNFTPDFDTKLFALFYQECKAACFTDMKQIENPDAQRRARKQWIHSQKGKQAVKDPYGNIRGTPNYGRNAPSFSLKTSDRNGW